MGILLVLILVFLGKPWWAHATSYDEHIIKVDQPPLPGENSVSNLRVTQTENGKLIAIFDYYYTGQPTGAYLRLTLPTGNTATDDQTAYGVESGVMTAQRGAHHLELQITRPSAPAEITTHFVVARMVSNQKVVTEQRVEYPINWPDWQTWAWEQSFAQNSTEKNYQQAVELIDSGGPTELQEAKFRLEKMISQDPKFERGYIELARVAMKSNWGPEGLHQAENLLASARQIAPDNVNAKILMGYVYAHQGRYKPAEALFAEAAQTDTKNLWLWANWGQLLAMQGKIDQAIPKYMEAIKRPRGHDTYDRAKLDAYENVLVLLDRRNDVNQMQDLYKQRADEFGPGSCYSAEYGHFMLHYRGDASAAADLANQSIKGRCSNPRAREVLGLAYYLKWALETGPQRDAILNQARLYLPAGPKLLYELANSDKTMPALKALKAQGEPIDQRDNENYTALAYAINRNDLAAANRLLALGAEPEALVGRDAMPIALFPVVTGNIAAIQLLQRSGVDYAKLRYRGITAIEHARQTGNSRLLEVLDPRKRAL